MIVIPPPKKNQKHILVIWLIEQHKDNDSSEKKLPNLYSSDRAHAWNWGEDEFSQRPDF